jgi:hypothetical protein
LLDSRRRARFTAVKSDARSCGGGRIRRRRALRRPLSSAPLSGSGGGLEGASARSSFLPCSRAQPGFGRGRRGAGEVPRRRTGWPAREGVVELESASAGRAPRSIHLEAAAGEGRVVEAELPGVAPRLHESSPVAANRARRRPNQQPGRRRPGRAKRRGSQRAAVELVLHLRLIRLLAGLEDLRLRAGVEDVGEGEGRGRRGAVGTVPMKKGERSLQFPRGCACRRVRLQKADRDAATAG